MDAAHALIHAARDAGADAVKFQWVYASEILHPKSGLVPLPGGDVPLSRRFQDLEVAPDFYASCLEEAHKSGVAFFCSPFGLRSLAELLALHPDGVKIASPELNHYPLLEALVAALSCPGSQQRPRIIFSGGVSKLGDMEKALEIFALSTPQPLITFLHCVTAYPAPAEDYNLHLIPNLAALYGVPCGVSDHSRDPVLVPTLAAALGAVRIEQQITLAKAGDGLDDPVALEPQEFAQMVASVREVGRKIEHQALLDTPKWDTIERLTKIYGWHTVSAVLGDGVKRLAPSEKANYGRTNRSLHYLRALKKGAPLGAGDIAPLRTEKVLNPGLGPEHLKTVLGAILARDVKDGAGVVWEDIIASVPVDVNH
jgi:sialic acid synthase SpsE